MNLKEIEKKKTLILGFGREGEDTFLFLRKLFPEKLFYLADKKKLEDFSLKKRNLINSELNSKKIRINFGDDYLNSLEKYDLIIKSPGIPFKEIPKSVFPVLTSQTKIFFDNFKGKIIGVTGTKGKGTTSFFIYSILRDAGKKVYFAGNIGRPVLNFIFRKDSIFVYELSSHQLYNLKSSPDIAVLLNIYPDHLDYYKDFKEYVFSKENITKHQTKKDFLVYNSEDPIVKKIAAKSKARKIPVKGKSIDLNINIAKKVAGLFDISPDQASKSIKESSSIEHRLEYVGNFEGIDFYNDSSSTIPESTIFALDFLKKKVKTLILGGSEKNLNFKKLVKRIEESEIKTLILFPVTGNKIWKKIKNKDKFDFFFTDNMKEAIKISFSHTGKGNICLLSPACASFTNFKDYKERGKLFKKYIKEFFNRKKNL